MVPLFKYELSTIPPGLKEVLAKHFKGYDGYDFNGVLAPSIVWVHMAEQIQNGNLGMNGCGSPDDLSKYVPETIWLLRITAICNIHDVCYKLGRTKDDCDRSNSLYLTNMVTFINNNSNFLMRIPRRYRAMTYYSATHEGRKKYCKGWSE